MTREEAKYLLNNLRSVAEGKEDEAIDMAIGALSAVAIIQTGQTHGKSAYIKELAEVVRCKDCKHWYADADTGMACEFTNMGQPEDGYCNWGERKGGEDDNA